MTQSQVTQASPKSEIAAGASAPGPRDLRPASEVGFQPADRGWYLILCWLLLALVTALASNAMSAATDVTNRSVAAGGRIDGESLVEDIDILEHAFKSLHAGLYRYNSLADIDLKFAELRERLRTGATLAETFVALSEFTASIRCGHTYPNFYNQDEGIIKALFRGRNRLPFEFTWLGGRMVITRNLSNNDQLRPGVEILSIDGVDAVEILGRLLKLARADGANDAKRAALLSVQGTAKYESFDIYYALCYPVKTVFTLGIRLPKAKELKRVIVAPLSFEDRMATLHTPDLDLKGDKPVWTLSFPSPRVALLRMSTWALYNSKWNWSNYLHQAFVQLDERQCKALIIDLRDNEGGLDVGAVIAQYLIGKPIQYGAYQRYSRYRSAPRELVPYLDTWDRSFLDWSTNAFSPRFRPQANAVYYRMTAFEDKATGILITPTAPRFRGKVAILMNAENSSATFQFEQLAQQAGLAILIGSPSGGNRRGINGSAFFFLHLPNSKIEVDVPLCASLPATSEPDAALVPDKTVQVTVAGLAEGRDEVLRAAMKILGAK